MNLTAIQFFLTTLDEERQANLSEIPNLTTKRLNEIMPSGLYRVIDGELFRINNNPFQWFPDGG